MYRARIITQQVRPVDAARDSQGDEIQGLLTRAADTSNSLASILADCLPVAERYGLTTWARWIELQLTGIKGTPGYRHIAELLRVKTGDPIVELFASRRRIAYFDTRSETGRINSLEIPILIDKPVGELEGDLKRLQDGIVRGGIPRVTVAVSAQSLPGFVDTLGVSPDALIPLRVPVESIQGMLDDIRRQIVEFLLEARRAATL